MRLVAIYNIFDGLELLEGSLSQIYSECFKVILHYQEISNQGEFDREVSEFVNLLRVKYPQTQPVRYEPQLHLSAIQNEKNKRRSGIAFARKLEASHFLLIDCDEYYRPGEFARAIYNINSNMYDSTACRLFTYYKEPTYQLIPIEDYYVPFIHSIDLTLTKDYHVYADPTRRAKGKNFHEFDQADLMMHHYSWVRKDIAKKLRNSSASVNWYDKIPAMISEYENFSIDSALLYYPGFSLIKVNDTFGIKMK